jgi:DHA1 family bicyclomycin/chloramphenicol resistance-like MFS transporter
VLRSSLARKHILAFCALVVPFWLFIPIAPILYMNDLGVSLENFGYYQGSLCTMFGTLSLMSGYFLRTYAIKACMRFGLISMGIFTVGTIGLILFQIQNPIIITITMLFLSVGVLFPINILYPLALEAVPGAKARIAALITSGRLIGTACGIQVVTYFYDGTFRILGIGMAVMVLFAFWSLYQLFTVQKPWTQT